MNEHDPSIEASLLAALKREMQRPADDAVMKEVATRLGAALGVGLSVASPAIAASVAPASVPGAASASAAFKLFVASHPLLVPLGVMAGSAALTGLSLFGVLWFSGPPSLPPAAAPRPQTVSVARSENRAQPLTTNPDGFAMAAPESSEPASAPTHGAKPASARLPTVATVTGAPPAEASLGAQQALLDTARRALSRGASAAALDALREHTARFPRSVLEEEREALTVKALRAAGRNGEADERATRFAFRYPASVFLPSVAAPSIP